MRNAETDEGKAVRENEDVVRAIVARHVPATSPQFEDALQEGRIALLAAHRTWSTSGGASFRTWAGPRIEWAVRTFLRKSSKEGFRGKGEPPHQRLSSPQRPGLRKGQWVSERKAPETLSLDAEQGCGEPLHDAVASSARNPEAILLEKEAREELHRALSKLSPGQFRILRKRFVDESTLRHIGEGLVVSPETVRRIESDALKALARDMKRAS